MGIYAMLNFTAPCSALSVLHQPTSARYLDDYEKTARLINRQIVDEAHTIQALWKTYCKENSERTLQEIRGQLSEFLSMPVSTDVHTVNQRVVESLSGFGERIIESQIVGDISSAESKHIHPRSLSPLMSQMINRSKKHLKLLGFKTAPASPPIYSNTLSFRGSINLDILEDIVRTRLKDGDHKQQLFDSANEITRVVLWSQIALIQSSSTARTSVINVTLMFQKDKSPNDLFEDQLKGILNELHRNIRLPKISLWRRRLGLSSFPEYAIVFAVEQSNAVKEILKTMNTMNMQKSLQKLLLRESLLFTEAPLL
jgi:hypothetical protein